MSPRFRFALGALGLVLLTATTGCQSCSGESRDDSAPALKPEEKGKLRGLARQKVVRPEFIVDGGAAPAETGSAVAPAPSAAPSASAH